MSERSGPFSPARVHNWPESLTLFGIATLGEFGALVGWFLLNHAHQRTLAALALLAGFMVERYVVVFWLQLPSRLRTPFGGVHPLWLILLLVTISEIAVWSAWIALAESGSMAAGIAVLFVGIHVVHSYEVALIRQSTVGPALIHFGTIVLSLLETIGGVAWLHYAAKDSFARGALVLLLALLVEHVLQVMGFKRGVPAASQPPDAKRPQMA